MYRTYFVDDEPLVLEEFMSNPLFAECGYQVVGSSENPLKAVKEIKKLIPDVVFTDLKMPYRSGVEMMEELRDKGVLCEFIVISAHPEFAEQRRFFLLDGFDYLLKPVSDQSLQQLLSRLSGKLAVKKPADLWPETTSPELNQIVAYLRENMTGKHILESISGKHHMSPSYVCQLFEKHLGTTFVAYMTKLRMEEAARLLKETRKAVKEISVLCGYKDYFYFCRVFRKHHSCTPTAFRESAK